MCTLAIYIHVQHAKYFSSFTSHGDVIKWKHYPRYWRFVRGIHRSPVNSPHKGQWLGALMISLMCVWINGWVNNGETGDLRRYRAHYEVTVMKWYPIQIYQLNCVTQSRWLICLSPFPSWWIIVMTQTENIDYIWVIISIANRLISEHFHAYDVPCGWLQRRKMQKMLVRKYFDDRLGLSITITSHGRHVVSNHRSLKCLFNSLCRPISKKHESPHYWPFVGNSSVTAEFPPHRGPVTRKKLTFYDVIMLHVHNTDIFESHP